MTRDDATIRTAQDEQDPAPSPAPVPEAVTDKDPLPAVSPQQGYLGFTLRELILIGVWLIAFALSFVPGAGSVLDSSATVWTMNGAWLLSIGVPTAAVFLVVLRRLSPEGIRRVGSLGIDQFASVAFSVALVSWVGLLWQQLDLVAATRRSALSTWPLWIEIVLMLVLVVATVFAVLIPGVREDFAERMDTLAHRNANPVRPVFARPRPVRARGSVSDPQNEDDVDPGLRHDGEVGAAGHRSSGATGAAVPGAAGYVPEQRRESFVRSDEEPAAAPGEEAPTGAVGTGAVAAEDAALEDAPAEEAPTEAEPAAEAPAAQAHPDETPTEAILDVDPETTLDSTNDAVPSRVAEAASKDTARRAATASESGTDVAGSDADPESASGSDSGSGSDSDSGSDSGADPEEDRPARPRSDTLTEVLGDLLVPAPMDDVATHAVDVVPEKDVVSEKGTRARKDRSTTAAAQAQPFWALAPETRAVHDARGDEIFTIGPDAWILVLEDRGGAFVVRHDDGRVGYLHDTDNMTRG